MKSHFPLLLVEHTEDWWLCEGWLNPQSGLASQWAPPPMSLLVIGNYIELMCSTQHRPSQCHMTLRVKGIQGLRSILPHYI